MSFVHDPEVNRVSDNCCQLTGWTGPQERKSHVISLLLDAAAQVPSYLSRGCLVGGYNGTLPGTVLSLQALAAAVPMSGTYLLIETHCCCSRRIHTSSRVLLLLAWDVVHAERDDTSISWVGSGS